jgi:YHS domain-containing protein
MKSLTQQLLIATACAMGLAVMPVRAQHEGHGHGADKPRHAEEMPAKVALPKCPVTGEAVNLAVRVATDAGPVFFCCKDCIPRYQANPAVYADKVTAQRKALADRAKVQVTCPVSGDPADRKVSVESDGKKVYFCCPGCINKYRADPGKFAAALANGYTYQTTCPVMGEPIDPKAFTTTADGERIYFCCDQCDAKFFANPAKYAPNLVAQGYTVNPAKMTHGDSSGHKDHDHGHDGHSPDGDHRER